jgi:tRNA G18 (ribose-2'-O)-methylase SpoU
LQYNSHTTLEKLKITEMNRLSAEEFQVQPKSPLVVVLDNVRSMHNVGSVFRTADAFLVEAVFLCGITCCPPHAEIHKTALGAENTVEWKYFEHALDAVNSLRNEGYTVLAIEQAKGSTLLPDLTVNSEAKYAVVLGNEVKGVQQAVVDACHGCVEIPQFGTKHSLNVSVTGGIIIWEMFRKLKGV